MRIAFVAYNGSVHTRRWVSYFAARGHDVHLVTCGGTDAADAGDEQQHETPHYPIYDLGPPRLGKLGYLFKIRRARRVLQQIMPDVVHAHFATSYGLLALASGMRPLVVTAHGDDVLIAPRKPWMRMIVRRVLRAAELITVPSDLMRSAVEQLVGEGHDAQVAVFQYGVESARLAELGREVRRDLQWHEAERSGQAGQAQADEPSTRRRLRIISTRAMLRLYRLDALVSALGLLADFGVEFHCDLLGDGPEREVLEGQVRALGLDQRVAFHGHLSAPQVERLVAGSDIYVSVSESDGVSLALLEAMALGVVPVLSDIPANRPWVHDGETGVLVDIDPASIADGIRRAAMLDRERVARDNHAIVAERADRATNLALCELMIDEIVGVRYEPDPVREDEGSDTEAA